ncbi:uncharacterized protein TNIN_200701 [Trichonephila inaurata madagascariensis]|uniref:Uncharacterized protein n=1 Tax=Trichonephila inaurata madagascariensis TaxID=2747483 RepID=A0A8X6X667_9ARAC|nr:uncharacterized protein TNIN_200701 [Trichonephila inaurata madagascariensis]
MYTKSLIVVLCTFFSILCFANVKSECPPEENIQPCRCETPNDPTIVCSEITKMETINDVFEKSNDIRFKYFILENSALQYLPASSLVSKRVLGLMIINTTLTGLFDEVPSSSNTVEIFSLNDVVIQRAIQWSMFQKLTKLKAIQFIDITIKKLGKDFISNITQGINIIFLSGNKMTSVAEGAFVNLNNLEFLSILNNDLKTLTRSMFGRPASIKYFEFMHNQIETLPDDFFTEMPHLQGVGLLGNRISILNEPVFANVVSQSAVLNVEENPIKCDCTLKWITKQDHKDVYGTCEEPSTVQGKRIASLSEEHFKYCN